MRTERYDRELHYAFLCDWWKARKHWLVSSDCLSETGLVVYTGQVPVAAAWLFLTNAGVGLIEWTVTNPDAPLRVRHSATELAHRRLEALATSLKLRFLFSFTSSRGIKKTMIRLGYAQAEPHAMHVKELVYGT